MHRRRVDEILLKFWSVGDGYEADDCGEPGAELGPSTYGEVTPVGARRVARALGIDGFEGDPVAFMDLGSGVGRLVAQSFLEFPRVTHTVGIELSPSRSARAAEAWAALLASGEAGALRKSALALAGGGALAGEGAATGEVDCEGLILVEGDLLAADVSSATHIYASSLCFEDDLLARLAGKLATEAPKLRGVASLRRFPRGSLGGFRLVGNVDAEMSWTGVAGTKVFLYERE